MRNLISAIIIDSDRELHDYSLIKSHKENDNCEDEFDLTIIDTTDNIEEILSDKYGFDCIITIGNELNTDKLSRLPFIFRRKWVHLESFNPDIIVGSIISTLEFNMDRKPPIDNKLFSFFTCTYKTSEEQIIRLYNSMKSQIYTEWDWFILDDSQSDEVVNIIDGLNDPRITVIKNHNRHGNIGFNKHTIAMICDGDYLVEVDHDDELTFDCLYFIKKAFDENTDADFVYSNAIELSGCHPIVYEDGWGWSEGMTDSEFVNGTYYTYSSTPYITPYSIRSIYSQPNHVRCWEKNFYHRIGGHNTELSVLDDMELLIRTFLHGKMVKINKVLYIQHFSDGERETGTTTQSKRFREIQRTHWYIKERYDLEIHNRIIELGYDDTAWDETEQCSILWKEHNKSQVMCGVYNARRGTK